MKYAWIIGDKTQYKVQLVSLKTKNRGSEFSIVLFYELKTVVSVRLWLDFVYLCCLRHRYKGAYVRTQTWGRFVLTGWSGCSGVWVYRAARRSSAGKSPPVGSGPWSACGHRRDWRAPHLHLPSTGGGVAGGTERLSTISPCWSWRTWVGKLTGKIWKCLILCMWHSVRTNVFGLLWLSLSRNTLKRKEENYNVVMRHPKM